MILNLLIENRSDTNNEFFQFGEVSTEMENCLSDKIDQSIQNQRFGQLPIALIYRVIEKCDRKKLSNDVLYDFIMNSINERFTLFFFIDVNDLSDEKFNDLYHHYILLKNTPSSVYFKCLPFDLMQVKSLKEVNKEVQKEKNEKNKLKEENILYTQIIEDLLKVSNLNNLNTNSIYF